MTETYLPVVQGVQLPKYAPTSLCVLFRHIPTGRVPV